MTANILKKLQKIPRNKGAAMMVSLVFFLFISLATVAGLTTPVIRAHEIANSSLNSKNAYFLSESGVEDAMYRILSSQPISDTEVITLGSNTATTNITSELDGSQSIEAIGDVASYERKVALSLGVSTGVSFNYGIQVGGGGMNISSSTVNGNVYANGPIRGDSSSSITGTAISGNSPSLSANQSNGSGTPQYNVLFGNNNASQDIAQSFQLFTESPLNKVSLYIKKNSNPNNATIRIVTDSNGSPSTTVIASGTLSASSVATSYGWIDISFSSNPILEANTTYWLVVDASTSSSKYYTIGANVGGYASGLGKIGQQGGTWNNTNPTGLDYFFNIYLGGLTGLIESTSGSQWNQLHIGTVSGSAQAHTVNYTNATGNIYCQEGTGNNKSCTTQADPVYISFPVSDANIESWKDEAEAGGITNGNVSVGWEGATLGPKKIIGNLSVSGGGVLTVTGTLWVTGNITLSGGGKIKLDQSYGADDGVLVADGNVSISGGANATGSGTAGSYIMLLSTSSSGSAVSVSGGAGAVIVYAPNGTVNISGGASLKEATGYRMEISGGSTITYESGLANNNFSSGPSGSWTLSGWGETD